MNIVLEGIFGFVQCIGAVHEICEFGKYNGNSQLMMWLLDYVINV